MEEKTLTFDLKLNYDDVIADIEEVKTAFLIIPNGREMAIAAGVAVLAVQSLQQEIEKFKERKSKIEG